VTAVVHTRNRTTMKGNCGRTTYKLWVGSALAVHHLRMFGCVTHVTTMGNLKKLDDSSKPVIFIDYEPRSKAYRTYDPATQDVRATHNVMFEEEAKWDWPSAQPDNDFIIDYMEVAYLEVMTVRQNEPGVVHN
jgi:hypothetical protein